VCGIIGYVGDRHAKDLLIQGLERLEYRGYDSAGICLLERDRLDYVRAVGNLEHLKAAADGEKEEWGTLYPTFARIADEEGFREIAEAFKYIAKVEVEHEKRYRKLLENVEKGKVFKKDKKAFWKCRNCGYLHEGTDIPDVCPACLHPRSYYEIAAENY